MAYKKRDYRNPLTTDESLALFMCEKYDNDQIMSFILGNSITIVIIVVNTILKEIIILMVCWIGEESFSIQLASITNGVFYAQFFNTGLLILLVNANMTEH